MNTRHAQVFLTARKDTGKEAPNQVAHLLSGSTAKILNQKKTTKPYKGEKEGRMSNVIVYTEIHLKKDQIVKKASELVKDHDSPDIRGMTEVSARLLKELNTLLHELDQLNMKIDPNE